MVPADMTELKKATENVGSLVLTEGSIVSFRYVSNFDICFISFFLGEDKM